MTYNVIKLTNDLNTKWDDFVKSDIRGTLFHTTIWKSLMEEVYGFKHNYQLVVNQDNYILAVFPCFNINSLIAGKKLQSIPYNYYGGLLYKDIEAGKALMEAYILQCEEENLDYLEIKTFYKIEDKLEKELNLKYSPNYLLSTLDLTVFHGLSDEALPRAFPRLVRRKLRDLREKGITVEKRHDKESVRIFYDMLLELYTKRLKTIPQPFNLFEKIFEKLIDNNMASILISKHGGEPIGGMLLMYYNGHLFDAWSFSSANHQNLSANYALVYEAIKLGIERKDRIFDLGVTSPSHSGLLEFKKKWRTDTRDFHVYYYLAANKQIPKFDYYTSMKTVRSLIPYIPKPIIKAASSIIVKHFS